MLRLLTYLQDAVATILYLVEPVGLEPTMPEAEDLQSPGVTNFPTTPKKGELRLQDLVPVAGEVSRRCSSQTGRTDRNRTGTPFGERF